MPPPPPRAAKNAAGTLILVVGPSGVGKDTLIDLAHAALAEDPRVVFALREITRAADAGGEAHRPVDWATFRARASGGAYLLWWQAHDLGYGLAATLAADLDAGRSVVANVSRSVIGEARRRFPRVKVISVAAAADQIIARLAVRGRESPGEIAARARPRPADAAEVPDLVVWNDGPPERAAETLVAAIRDWSAPPPQMT